MRKVQKRPRLKADEHPRPQVMVPMSIFGDIFFADDHARVGRFVHLWCHAVWKKDPSYRPFADDDNEDTLKRALLAGYVVCSRGKYRLTGPNKDKRWLLDKRKRWQTYVIEAVGQDVVKIGKSTDVERRFDGLQVASPHELRLLVVFDDDIESDLHRQFSADRVGGEWFRYSDHVRGVLASMEVE